MKKATMQFILLMLFALFLATQARADPKYYIDFKAGGAYRANKFSQEFKGGKLSKSASFSLAVGIMPIDQVAFDLSLTYNPKFGYKFVGPYDIDPTLTKINSSKFRNVTITTNGYYFLLDKTSFIIPYVGAGIGWSRNTISNNPHYIDGEYNFTRKGGVHNDLAWKLTAGSLFKLNDKVKLSLEYSYTNLGHFKSGKVDYVVNGDIFPVSRSKTKIRTHSIMVGLRYEL